MKNKLVRNHWPLVIISLLGFLLRFWRLKINFNWGLEQSAVAWRLAKIFLEKNLPLIGMPLFSLKSGIFQPPFLFYFLALPFKFSGFNPLVLEIIFGLIGCLMVVLIYITSHKIASKNTAIIASLIYSSSFNLIKFDKTVWGVTPVILTATLILLAYFQINRNKYHNTKKIFILGCLLGLGFSFHSQIIVFGFTLVFLFIIKRINLKAWLAFTLGVLLLLSPLIIFNFRHQNIIIKGILNLVVKNEVIISQNQGLQSRISNSVSTLVKLASSILGIKNPATLTGKLVFVIALYFIPTYLAYFNRQKRQWEQMGIFFLLSCSWGVLGLSLVNQGFYQSTAFYLWCLIPLLIITWAKALACCYQKNKLAVIFSVCFFIISNLYLYQKQKSGNFVYKTEVVNYILQNRPKNDFSIKFINKDVLSYSFLIFSHSLNYKLDYNKINLIEQWQQDKADIFLIEGEYNWQEDTYQVKPFLKQKKFDNLTIIIK